MNIAILDGVVVAVVFISAILAMFRGFVREVLSIAAWVAAAVLAYVFYEELVPYVSEYVDNPTIAIGLSAAAIFLVALIVVSLITMKISDFVMDSPVGVLDRLIGFIFGAARGLLLVVVAVVFFNWLVANENRPAWVTTATSYPQLTEWGNELLAAIPDDPEQAIRDAFEPQNVTPDAPGATTPGTLAPEEQRQLDQLLDAQDPAATEPGADTTLTPPPPALTDPAPAAPAPGLDSPVGTPAAPEPPAAETPTIVEPAPADNTGAAN